MGKELNFDENLKTRNGKKKIVSERVGMLMAKAGMTQAEFGDVLINKSGKPISQTNISLWLTGKRSIPQKYLEPISSIFGVSEPYLLGLTDDAAIGWDEITEETSSEDSIYEIDAWQLYAYANKPVFIVFPNMEHEDAWAIYNRDDRTFAFASERIREANIKNCNARFFTKDIRDLDDPLKTRKSIDYATMLSVENVYVHMITSNQFIHGKFDGWYKHTNDHSALINNDGNILPYEGLKKSFLAYTYSNPSGGITNDKNL